ncbi:hypothetical protein [Actinomyces dentalis]|uniref:hypothetical protein n=1 Tax=Actinomyces dentalis TaxID=272548 RepID=UPI0028EE5093|nr:hypothetical protein [Actinomyces dentalis]
MPADDAPDPAPVRAAGHSPSEPASPPAPSDLADAPRPRRRAPGPARRRAASTGFLLGSLAALLVTIVLAVVRHRQMPFTDFSNATSCIVYGVLGGLILLPALAAVEQFRTVVRCIWAILFLGACVPAALPLRDWWKIYRQTTVPPHYLAALAAAYLAAGLLIFCIFRIASARIRRRAGRPARSAARGAARRHRRPPAIRLLLRGLRRRLPRAVPAPRALAVGAVGFLVPVLACTGLAVLPSALVRPAISTTAPVPAAIPARPEAVSGELAWTRLVEDPLDVVAGEAGPVVVQSGAVRGLDPATGAVRWSYERPGADFIRINGESGLVGERHIVTSPNGRYAALRVGTDRQSALTVVLDTRTGRVTAEHPGGDRSSLQLTDTAALDGDRAFSLIDGRDLWTLPDPDGKDSRSYDSGYTGSAGHSTFIGYDDPGQFRPGTWNDLTLIPDADPTATTRIDHVLTDPTNQRFVIVDGWTAQLTGEGAQAAEATLAAIREARDAARTNSADAEPVMLGWQAQAVNIDALAGSAAEAGTAPVPMGVGSGINSGASLASGDLCLFGQHLSDISMEDLRPDDDRVVVVSSLLDTATRTVRTPETDPGLASVEVGIEATVQNGNTTGSVVVRPGDGGAPISAPIGEGSALDQREPFGARLPVQQMQGALRHRDAVALTVPGATLLIVTPSGHLKYSTPAPPIRIYAVPGGFP